jgi:hypothetical protein
MYYTEDELKEPSLNKKSFYTCKNQILMSENKC